MNIFLSSLNDVWSWFRDNSQTLQAIGALLGAPAAVVAILGLIQHSKSKAAGVNEARPGHVEKAELTTEELDEAESTQKKAEMAEIRRQAQESAASRGRGQAPALSLVPSPKPSVVVEWGSGGNPRIRAMPSPSTPKSADKFTVRLSDESGAPVEDAEVVAFRANGTSQWAISDSRGQVVLRRPAGGFSKLFVALADYRPCVVPVSGDGRTADVTLQKVKGGGSVVIRGTGFIPGLAGRLNPIKDAQGRFYLYADNIAHDSASNQPYDFVPGVPFTLEDARGNSFEVTVLDVVDQTSLLSYGFRSVVLQV